MIFAGIIEHESAVYVENDETWYNNKPPNNVIVRFSLVAKLLHKFHPDF